MDRSLFRTLAAVVLALGLSACSGTVDLGSIGRQLGGAGAATPAAGAAMTTGDPAQIEAVKQTIQRANEAQAKAFNSGDPSFMRATATADFFTQLQQTNRDLAAAGVRLIELVSIDFPDVGVSGGNATATTLETWSTTYADGSSDRATARNDYTLVLIGAAWKIATDDQPSSVIQRAPQPQPDTGAPAAASTVSTSSNWSGYSATGGSFTSVTGTWTVPTVSAATNGADATWVGIGGIDSNDLIQAGTEATVSGGAVTYNAWIEMLPASSKSISLSVGPGDSVTVTISQKSAGLWVVALRNNTTGGAYDTTVRYASTHSSAEWVQEAPSVNRGTVPLDDFGTVRFQDASAVRDGSRLDLASLGVQAITMINGARQPIAIPSVLGSDGASFAVTRTHNASAGAAGTGRRRRG